MKASQTLERGALLKLKANNPYGLTAIDRYIVVDRLKFKPGYKTPWIIDADGRAFQPRDFV